MAQLLGHHGWTTDPPTQCGLIDDEVCLKCIITLEDLLTPQQQVHELIALMLISHPFRSHGTCIIGCLELTGTFTEVGVSVNGLQTAVVRNNGSGGIALELGKEVAFPDEPFGGEVLSGNSFQISGP